MFPAPRSCFREQINSTLLEAAGKRLLRGWLTEIIRVTVTFTAKLRRETPRLRTHMEEARQSVKTLREDKEVRCDAGLRRQVYVL
jgi:hypothetical protein